MPAASESAPFRYPPQPHQRRHGPRSYAVYESFRPWLRDEFSFRCVYCLIREQWGRVTAEFDLDHFIPQSLDPARALEYDNLLYACRACNARRGRRPLPDPTAVLTATNVRIYPNGTLAGLDPVAEKIIRLLCLNSPTWVRWRRTWTRIVELAAQRDPDLHRELMTYPKTSPTCVPAAHPRTRDPAASTSRTSPGGSGASCPRSTKREVMRARFDRSLNLQFTES